MISHRNECIFVHVPKCGGSSIEAVIWPEPRRESDLWMGFTSRFANRYQTGGLQHLLARQIREEVGYGIYQRYFKFAIVRNPWDKAVSQFAFMQRRPDLRELIGMRARDPFKRYLSLIAKTPHVQWHPQHDFLCDEQGRRIVDFVGRFESFERDVATIFEHLNIVARIPRLNATRRGRLDEYYDDEAREMVAALYAEDIRAFDYAFPSNL